MTKNRSNKKSRNKYKVSGGVGGRGGRGLTNNKKTRPLGGRRRRNRSQNQEGGMKYRTMLEKNADDLDEMGYQISKIIPRLFAGLYASWGARKPDIAEVGKAYTYADIGGSLTHNGGNKFILKTRAGLNGNHTTKNLSDYVMYSDWYVYELHPTPEEIAAYKKMSDPKDGTSEDDKIIIRAVWKGQLTKSVWDGNVETVNTMLTTIRAQYKKDGEGLRSDLGLFGQVAYSIITSTTLSRDTITAPDAIKNASHTLLYTACRSPKVTPEMIIMLIGHGCNVNQPNGAVRFADERSAAEWASGANLTPLWGLVKCIYDISRMASPNWSEKINKFKRCLAALVESGANQNWRDDQGLTISKWLTQQQTTEQVTVPDEFNLNMMGQPSGEVLFGWKTAEKTNVVQYYRHTDGGTTYQCPDKELKLSLYPTPIADAAAAKAVAAKAVSDAVAAKAAPAVVATAASSGSVATPSTQLSVNQFCSMLKDPGGDINEKISTALAGKRLTDIKDKFETISGNENTALYCACRSPKTTLVSIRKMVNELQLDVNLQNNGNNSTPLHGLVQRLRDAIGAKIKADGASPTLFSAASAAKAATAFLLEEYNRIYAIMLFLVNEKKADITLANAYSNGGTALEEFTKLPAEKNHLTDAQTAEITELLTPPGAAAAPLTAPKSATAAAPKSATAATDMSVDEFCTIAYGDGADAKIKEAIESGRTSRDVTGKGFVTGERGTGNTALYCACRSPMTTVASIDKMVNGNIFWNMNIQNNNNNASTPLHGLVERLRAADSNVPVIIDIMTFLVVTKKADRTLANTVVNGGTALREFKKFTPEEIKRLQGRKDEITELLTPTAEEIGQAAKEAFRDKLCTNLQVDDLHDVIVKHYKTNVTTWKPQTKGANGNNTWKKYIEDVMDELTIASDAGTRKFKKEFADIPDVDDVGNMLRATTVGDIEKEYLRFSELAIPPSSSPPPKNASFTIVGPFIDGKYALKSKLARNSIVQVASQFNFLESQSSEYTEIILYPHDPTQGPGSSMASLEALILRDAAIKPPARDGELQELGKQPIFNGISWYENGYLMPDTPGLTEQELLAAADHIDKNIGTLKILAQESIPEFSIDSDDGHPCVQVFSAAPSYQNSYYPPLHGSAGAKICEVLVLAQYRSIARLAVIKSIAEPSKPVNLHLTGVGQGAFNNPPSLFDKFIEEVWNIVKPFNVSVYMHVYGDPKIKGVLNWDENNLVFVTKVTQINTLFDNIDKDAKTDSGKLPQLSAEKFINYA
jgi:hypothetical protein